ncbi:MAG: RNase adapter RapZ [Kiloniellaceae bacterium]
MAKRLVHATCIAIEGADGPLGVLLRGPSGAGKSDLALRLIDQGARLVADDQCELRRTDRAGGAGVTVRAAASIAGRMEVRGVGIVEVPTLSEARLALVVDLVGPEAVERLPDDDVTEDVLGLALPRVALDPFETSAPAKVRAALRARGGAARAADEARSAPAGAPARRRGHKDRRRVVLVTGLSGAGHSTALKILEDMGYEAIDNLPLNLLDAVLAEKDSGRPIAVGVDIRTRRFAAETVLNHLDRLGAKQGLAVTLVFLECQDDVLERRFTETRRRHPLARDRRVADGIAAERRLVAPLRERADLMVDTSALSPAELRGVLGGHLGLEQRPGMTIFITSFSYRYGLPRVADLVFDVRFLANPHYVPELRPLDGRNPQVSAYVERDPAFADFFERLTAMLEPLLPRYEQEGKSYLTIAVGCTGGRHRSVVVAERLAAWLTGRGRRANVIHRDAASDDGGGGAVQRA